MRPRLLCGCDRVSVRPLRQTTAKVIRKATHDSWSETQENVEEANNSLWTDKEPAGMSLYTKKYAETWKKGFSVWGGYTANKCVHRKLNWTECEHSLFFSCHLRGTSSLENIHLKVLIHGRECAMKRQRYRDMQTTMANIGELLANFSWTDQGNCMQPLKKTYPILIPSWPCVTILTHRPNDENAETVVIRWISALRCISHGAIPAQVFKTQ